MMKNNLFLFLILILVHGCGNGSETGNSKQESETVMNISFAPEVSTETMEEKAIYMIKNDNDQNKNEITIDILAKGIANKEVLGMAFELNFDSNIIMYNGKDNGDLFIEDKSNIIIAPEGASNDKLLVGITTKDKANKIGSDGVLISIRFKVNSIGNAIISFKNNEVRDLSNKKIDMFWYGGTISSF